MPLLSNRKLFYVAELIKGSEHQTVVEKPNLNGLYFWMLMRFDKPMP
jgi:hypothetical protein